MVTQHGVQVEVGPGRSPSTSSGHHSTRLPALFDTLVACHERALLRESNGGGSETV